MAQALKAWAPWMPGFALSPQVRGMFGFTLRNWIASMLALYIAMALQLESPVWSWLTVWIVAQPAPGMVLSKSLYRVIGTIAGAAIAVVLMAFFAQTPELFVLALALLVGGCTVASNILTNFRGYATVLAGYTASIVAADSISAPDQVFFIALMRGSAVIVGISCGVLVNSLFAPHRAEADTRARLAALLKDVARRAVFSWQGAQEERLTMGRKLIEDSIALDTLIEFAAAESGIFRLQANNARSLVSHVFGVISARRSLDAHLHRCGWPRHEALQIYHGVIIDLLNDLPGELDLGRIDEQISAVQGVRRELALLDPERDGAGDVVSTRLVIDRLDDLLEHLERALANWRDIVQERWHRTPGRTLNFHRDLRLAGINGLRAVVAVCITGAFWIGTAWPHGPSALVFVCVTLSLFSTFPRPDLVTWYFFLASAPAVLVALFCKYYVMPYGSGFDYLILATGLFLVPMGLFMAHPKTTAGAVAFSLIFLNLLGPANPQVYDLADTINTAIALELGVLAGVASFVLIMPPNPQAARRYVTYRIRLGLGLLAANNPIPDFSDWETRMYDRVNRLRDPANPSGVHTDEWLEAGLGALTLGNEILRLRHWLAEETLSPGVRNNLVSILAPMGSFCREPEPAYAALKHGRARIALLDPGVGDPLRRAWARVLGALEEMDVYLAVHPRLLKRQPVT